MTHQGEEIALGLGRGGGGGQRAVQIGFARQRQIDLAAQQALAGDDAQIAAMARHHEAFDQGVGIFRQQHGAQVGGQHMFVHDQRRGIRQPEDGLLAVEFGRILPGVTGQIDQPVDQALDMAVFVQHGGCGDVRIGQQPVENLATALAH